MQSNHFFCRDVQQKCMLDCVYVKNGYHTVSDITLCQNNCTKSYELCEDDSEAVVCKTCLFNCTEVLDTALRLCVSKESTITSFEKDFSCTTFSFNQYDLCKFTCCQLSDYNKDFS